MADRPTLRKVAELAGVSLGTASQALSNKPGVLPETRARVLDAASTLGYVPAPRTDHTVLPEVSTIGLLLKNCEDGNPALNPFYSHVLSGAERECKRQSLNLMYATLDVDRRNHASALP